MSKKTAPTFDTAPVTPSEVGDLPTEPLPDIPLEQRAFRVTQKAEVMLTGFSGFLYPGKVVSPRHYSAMDMGTLLRTSKPLGLIETVELED